MVWAAGICAKEDEATSGRTRVFSSVEKWLTLSYIFFIDKTSLEIYYRYPLQMVYCVVREYNTVNFRGKSRSLKPASVLDYSYILIVLPNYGKSLL